MVALAVALLAIGSVGIISAILLELKRHEPKYVLMMKIFPWVFGVGAILLAIAL